ncbi:sigma-54-dependent Fis family transcriptional regulator [Candidatus Saganbacteria bacterium]|nr:sigma-54-dependent Fis family transcriptional regulator [Candidatus Saganbacteria bacterium]
MNSVLVVDDEFSIRESFKLILSPAYEVLQAATGEGALKLTVDNVVDLVYLDIRMPGMDGIETLKRLKEISPQTEVVMVTAVNDVQKASEAIKIGAFDYVVKPFDVEKIQNLTRDILRRKNILASIRGIGELSVPSLVGRTEKINQIMKRIEGISGSFDWALITGEAGVEKEWIARLINDLSPEPKRFAAINCKGRSAAYLNKKLFPGKMGNSTTELSRDGGLINSAQVLFIDNIEYLPQETQEKLLKAPIRLICGAIVNLKEINFNNELWQKLSAVQFEIPPLRERAADIPIVIDYFFNESKKNHNSKIKEIFPGALNIFSAYTWPGNIDELQAVIERLVLTVNKPFIEENDLPIHILLSNSVSHTLSLEDAYSEFEKKFIGKILEMNSQDKEKTARALNIKPLVLDSKL